MNKHETGGWIISPDFRIISYLNSNSDTAFLSTLTHFFPGGFAGFRGMGGELLFLNQGVADLLEIPMDQLIPGSHLTFQIGRCLHTDPTLAKEAQRQIDETGKFKLIISLERPQKGLIRLRLDGGPCEHPEYGSCILCLFSDVTGNDHEIYRLTASNLRDETTGLSSARYFRECCGSYLKHDGEEGTHAYFVVNIDDFRQAGAALGQASMNKLLGMVGTLMTRTFRDSDILGRAAEDKFSILMKDVPSLYIVEERAKTVCQMLRQLFLEFEFPPGTCSIGGVYGRLGHMSENEISEHADHALYRAKTQGNGHWDIYADSGQLSVHSMSKKQE